MAIPTPAPTFGYCARPRVTSRDRTELSATGARPRREALLRGPKSLTPSERRIAEMAAAAKWKIEELHTEEGRLDEVFRNITLPETAARSEVKEEKK